MFRYRQQLRCWAAQVLLLWLLGVGAGFANACLAPDLKQFSGHAVAQASDEGLPHNQVTSPGIHHHGSNQAHQDVDSQSRPDDAAKSKCVDFCDKVSVSIAPLKSALDDFQGHALPSPAVVTFLPVPVFVPARLWVSRLDWVWATAIPIVFLRLAL